jgi:hypothetical protein
MLIEFSELFPRFKFIRYQQRIVAINQFYAKGIDDQLDTICQTLQSFLEKYDAICGVSLFFTSLREMPFSFKQTSLALKYAHHKRGSQSAKISAAQAEREQIHFFSRSYSTACSAKTAPTPISGITAIIMKCSESCITRQSPQEQQFAAASRVSVPGAQRDGIGQRLNMHRNNVTYHISRIQELLDVNLDDPYVRFMMRCLFSCSSLRLREQLRDKQGDSAARCPRYFVCCHSLFSFLAMMSFCRSCPSSTK